MRGGLGQESGGEKRRLQKRSRADHVTAVHNQKLEIYKDESKCASKGRGC